MWHVGLSGKQVATCKAVVSESTTGAAANNLVCREQPSWRSQGGRLALPKRLSEVEEMWTAAQMQVFRQEETNSGIHAKGWDKKENCTLVVFSWKVWYRKLHRPYGQIREVLATESWAGKVICGRTLGKPPSPTRLKRGICWTLAK